MKAGFILFDTFKNPNSFRSMLKTPTKLMESKENQRQKATQE